MLTISLVRHAASPKYPEHTPGVLMHGGDPVCCTLELPWRDNQRNVSCIQDGIYRCTRIKHERFGECFRIHNVPGRDGVLIHCGNRLADTHGGILVGVKFVPLAPIQPWLERSHAAMTKLLQLAGEELELLIWQAIS